MLKALFAGISAMVVIAGSSLGHAQTVADMNALTDARIEIVKTALQLTPDQEKLWPAVEQAIRSRAKERLTRLANVAARTAELKDKSYIEILRNRNPIEFLNRRSDALAQRAADLKKLASAWQPLYQTLSADQKRRLGVLGVYVIREMRDNMEERRLQGVFQAEEEGEEE
jgi:hypothetical protein